MSQLCSFKASDSTLLASKGRAGNESLSSQNIILRKLKVKEVIEVILSEECVISLFRHDDK
jgi:hypothetical protein